MLFNQQLPEGKHKSEQNNIHPLVPYYIAMELIQHTVNFHHWPTGCGGWIILRSMVEKLSVYMWIWLEEGVWLSWLRHLLSERYVTTPHRLWNVWQYINRLGKSPMSLARGILWLYRCTLVINAEREQGRVEYMNNTWKKKGRKSIRRFPESNTMRRDEEEGAKVRDRREERSEDGEGGKRGKTDSGRREG